MTRERSARQWILVPLICGLLGFLFAIRQYLLMLQKNEPILFIQSLSDQLSYWLLWAIFSPLIFWLGCKFPFQKPGWLHNLFVHLAAAALIAVAHPVLYLLLSLNLDGWQSSPPVPLDSSVFYQIWTVSLIPGVIFYWLILAVNLAFDYQRRYRDETLKAAELHAQLAQAQLAALKMQLHPHFLFNALHSITALVLKKDDRTAVRMISRLSDLLRRALEDSEAQQIPLKREIEFLRLYLEIEQTRFADRLTVEMRIDPETLDAQVPNLILQPLVENAVRHGFAASSAASRIEICAARLDGKLRLEVSDDGRGLPVGWDGESTGIGIKNTRERLAQLYGAQHEFEVCNNKNGGVTATLWLPYQCESENQKNILEAL